MPCHAMYIRQLHTHTTAAALISMQTEMQCATGYVLYRALFRSALGMGKIMRDPAPHVAHGQKTLQMCGSKIIPAFDSKGFMLHAGTRQYY